MIKLALRVGTLCAALLGTSCASITPRFLEVHIPPERISQQGYSLVPLNETGWLIGARNSYQLALLKRGEDPEGTLAIQATLVELPAFKTDEELARLVKERQAQDTDPQRFTTMTHEVTAYSQKGTTCVKSHLVTEDHAAVKRSATPGDMVLEALTLTCPHPNDQHVGVNVTYSQRYYPEQRDPAFLEKATRVLESIEFTELQAKIRREES